MPSQTFGIGCLGIERKLSSYTNLAITRGMVSLLPLVATPPAMANALAGGVATCAPAPYALRPAFFFFTAPRTVTIEPAGPGTAPSIRTISSSGSSRATLRFCAVTVSEP